MKIKREVEVTLTVEEVEELIKKHLKEQKINVSFVRFNIEEKYSEGDWKAEFPPTPVVTKITATGTDTE